MCTCRQHLSADDLSQRNCHLSGVADRFLRNAISGLDTWFGTCAPCTVGVQLYSDVPMGPKKRSSSLRFAISEVYKLRGQIQRISAVACTHGTIRKGTPSPLATSLEHTLVRRVHRCMQTKDPNVHYLGMANFCP